MAAAMLPRLVAVAALVALMCAVAVAQAPAAGGAPVCEGVDQNVVNACFKSFGEGMKIAIADRKLSEGNVIKVKIDCCVAFGGHSCLCKMKKVWKAQSKSAQDNVQCVREKAC
ncbi:hypothetical protein D1007_03711 [Hordeum vulgare]|uniref:Predicted protein n=1 Tax=Hordeum vulgare subsp. vulgare TaxID=112509 RepID=F2CZ63_HORVV|nr:uncharacterized protein LOC123431070 [Hordeum vulgare subsp. vulgare]KAE8818575.1 hypothetical protein D1007_03711 [Hordeum vulgare]KAI5010146.1 hypothetical protein ZWY2020_012283 [Hordeum vulgare]BAJ88134.1 predicted protein [Hordeum vulgare subsp. vulgare]